MILFLDVETTGFKPMVNDVIQVGAVISSDEGEILGEFMEYGRPIEKNWCFGAEKVK